MYTPGTILRLAREERKLSISEAKYFAKIRESAIIAMENDEYERFPAAYMQTFLPLYADFLGVSHYRLAEAFKATLPEYGYLTRSLYSRTLRQISLAQSKLEYARNHPSLGARIAGGVRAYGMRLAVTCACIAFLAFSWFSLRSESSLLGSALAGRFVATPEDMRGVRFDELEQTPVGVCNDQMQTVRLASIIGVKIDMKSLAAIALKQTAEQTESASLARRNSAIDASSRSVSSIASAMLAETSERQTDSSMGAHAEASVFARSIPARNLAESAPAERTVVLSAELRSEEIRGLAEATSFKSAPKAFVAVTPVSVPSAFSRDVSGFVLAVSPTINQPAHQSVFKQSSPFDIEAARRAALEALRIAREESAKRAAPRDGNDEDRSFDNADTTAGDEAPPASEDGRS